MSEQSTLTESAMPGTGAGAIEFLDRATERGWLNATTAQPLRTATIKILSIDENWKDIDLHELDLEEQFDRFHTLRRLDYSDGSFKNYKSRFHHTVGMYLAWLRKEPDWKSYGPGTRGGGSSRNGRSTANKPVKVTVPTPVVSPPPEAVSSTRSIQHTYPLRDDVDAVLHLPRDLTTAEANRLAKFISSLAWDDTTPSAT